MYWVLNEQTNLILLPSKCHLLKYKQSIWKNGFEKQTRTVCGVNTIQWYTELQIMLMQYSWVACWGTWQENECEIAMKLSPHQEGWKWQCTPVISPFLSPEKKDWCSHFDPESSGTSLWDEGRLGTLKSCPNRHKTHSRSKSWCCKDVVIRFIHLQCANMYLTIMCHLTLWCNICVVGPNPAAILSNLMTCCEEMSLLRTRDAG